MEQPRNEHCPLLSGLEHKKQGMIIFLHPALRQFLSVFAHSTPVDFLCNSKQYHIYLSVSTIFAKKIRNPVSRAADGNHWITSAQPLRQPLQA